MMLEPKYAFKYYPSYGGYKLCKLDPIHGNIVGYVTNYGVYSKILKSHPELKKPYSSEVISDKKKLKNALIILQKHNYSHGEMLDQAMKLGVLREDVESLVAQKNKLFPKGLSMASSDIIDLDDIKRPPMINNRERLEAGGYYMASTDKPEYLSLEERRKRKRKMKMKRKTKRCKCKK